MSKLISQTVDKKQVTKILKELSLPIEHEDVVAERLEPLLKYIRRIESDIEADKGQDINGIRPQDRREMLLSIAEKLENSRDRLNVFREPKLRYRENPEFPRTRPVGLIELRETISRKFSSVLSTEYVSGFGPEPIQWPPGSRGYHLNEENRAFAIEASAEDIIGDLLHRLSDALREAEARIAKEKSKSGPRYSKIRNIILTNVVAIWHDFFAPSKKASYNRNKTKFFKFCQGICMAIDAGGLCTEAHLRAAVANYNAQKNLP